MLKGKPMGKMSEEDIKQAAWKHHHSYRALMATRLGRWILNLLCWRDSFEAKAVPGGITISLVTPAYGSGLFVKGECALALANHLAGSDTQKGMHLQLRAQGPDVDTVVLLCIPNHRKAERFIADVCRAAQALEMEQKQQGKGWLH